MNLQVRGCGGGDLKLLRGDGSVHIHSFMILNIVLFFVKLKFCCNPITMLLLRYQIQRNKGGRGSPADIHCKDAPSFGKRK